MTPLLNSDREATANERKIRPGAPPRNGAATETTILIARYLEGRDHRGEECVCAGALLQDTALKDAGLDNSTPETLTTACHAASWLSRSWRCVAEAAPQLGLRTSLEPRRRIAPRRSASNPDASEVATFSSRSPASDSCRE